MDNSEVKYSIRLSFEEIKLPPFQDILVLGKNSPQGRIGLSKSFELLIPNGFEVVEIMHEKVEAVFINRRILSKIAQDQIIKILETKVFPFISEGEILRVEFKVNVSFNAVEYES